MKNLRLRRCECEVEHWGRKARLDILFCLRHFSLGAQKEEINAYGTWKNWPMSAEASVRNQLRRLPREGRGGCIAPGDREADGTAVHGAHSGKPRCG